MLEIGTGWGGFALHAAGRHGCRVTTTTISRGKFELARERVRAAGLEDRITILLEDYRDLRIVHLEDIGPHYATTLSRWRRNFFANIAGVRAMGYPETFNRMWEFYLRYCEAGFAEHALGDVQVLLARD